MARPGPWPTTIPAPATPIPTPSTWKGRRRSARRLARMKRRDVRALGWVVTRDACVEIARRLLGRRRRMPTAALRELGARWRDIHASPIADKAGPIDAFLVGQPATAQSKECDKTVIAFVDCLQHFRPDLYSEQALRKRCLSGCGHVIVSLAFGAIVASFASSDIPIIGDAALVLFAIASWYLVTTIQLWRTHLLVKRVSQLRTSADLVTQGSLARPADGLPNP